MGRKEDRIKKIFKVKLKDESNTYPATITSLSKSGMSVRTPHVFPTYKAIEVLVKIEQRVIPIKGSIRWVHEPELSVDSEPPGEGSESEIGISLLNPPTEYLRHFE